MPTVSSKSHRNVFCEKSIRKFQINLYFNDFLNFLKYLATAQVGCGFPQVKYLQLQSEFAVVQKQSKEREQKKEMKSMSLAVL